MTASDGGAVPVLGSERRAQNIFEYGAGGIRITGHTQALRGVEMEPGRGAVLDDAPRHALKHPAYVEKADIRGDVAQCLKPFLAMTLLFIPPIQAACRFYFFPAR